MSLADVEVREIRNLVFRLNEILKKRNDSTYLVKEWDYLFVNSHLPDFYTTINEMYKKLGEGLTEVFNELQDEVDRKKNLSERQGKKKK